MNARERTIQIYHLREYDESRAAGWYEMPVIRRFAALVKHVDKSACEEAVRKLEEMRDKG